VPWRHGRFHNVQETTVYKRFAHWLANDVFHMAWFACISESNG
jgi:hypothetical protein